MNNTFRSTLEAECERVLTEMAGASPASDEYQRLLGALTNLFYMFQHLSCDERNTALPAMAASVSTPAVEHEEPEEDATEPEGQEEPTTEPEKPALKKETVRAALAEAKANGVSVSTIIQSFGVSKFSDIPAESYPEVMEQLAEASR